jgi:hypothetical protein
MSRRTPYPSTHVAYRNIEERSGVGGLGYKVMHRAHLVLGVNESIVKGRARQAVDATDVVHAWVS